MMNLKDALLSHYEQYMFIFANKKPWTSIHGITKLGLKKKKRQVTCASKAVLPFRDFVGIQHKIKTLL